MVAMRPKNGLVENKVNSWLFSFRRYVQYCRLFEMMDYSDT